MIVVSRAFDFLWSSSCLNYIGNQQGLYVFDFNTWVVTDKVDCHRMILDRVYFIFAGSETTATAACTRSSSSLIWNS